jgi:hypothetical protein
MAFLMSWRGAALESAFVTCNVFLKWKRIVKSMLMRAASGNKLVRNKDEIGLAHYGLSMVKLEDERIKTNHVRVSQSRQSRQSQQSSAPTGGVSEGRQWRDGWRAPIDPKRLGAWYL